VDADGRGCGALWEVGRLNGGGWGGGRNGYELDTEIFKVSMNGQAIDIQKNQDGSEAISKR
jgi:hypothetical protein